MLSEVAPAKINLALHVTGQRDDGYHLLDTLVTFADVGDVLTFEPANTLSLDIEGPYGSALSAVADNMVLKAARRLADVAGSSEVGASIVLTKNLPVASGIGGGSADAAAELRGLSRLWALDVPEDEMQELALSLGADVPMCLTGKPLRASGIGDALETLIMPSLSIILVNPNVPVSTPEIFAELDRKDNEPMGAMPHSRSETEWLDAMREWRNDLQVPAMRQAPEIAACLAMLERSGADLVRMSGSGATCFGLFGSDGEADRASQAISLAQPHWWVAAGRTV